MFRQGRLRLNASASFATHVLMPLLPEFLSAYPELSVEASSRPMLSLTLMAERVDDIAIRGGRSKPPKADCAQARRHVDDHRWGAVLSRALRQAREPWR